MKTEYKKAIEKYKNIILEQKKVIIILAIAVFTIASLFALVFVPPWRVAQFGINDSVKIAELENSYRATIAQIFGGLAIIIGLYYTWQRITIAEENLKITQENLKVAQEGQITERFTRAVEQLGSKNLQIRLGGIYSLERIANESDKDYWPIMEILAAYIKINSPFKNKDTKAETFENVYTHDGDLDVLSILELLKQVNVPLDIETVIGILKTRKYRPYSFKDGDKIAFNDLNKFIDLNNKKIREPRSLDLQRTYLACVNLRRAHLEGAWIGGSFLGGAQLEGAHLASAVLPGVIFKDASLENADFGKALLTGVNFERANLKGSNLEGANLQAAYLRGAHGLSIEQLAKVKTLYNAELDDELLIPLKEKYPALFEETNCD